LAGRVALAADSPLRQYFVRLLAIGHASVELDKAMQNTAQDLRCTANELGNRLAVKG
jgi:hypothetical protein